MPKRTKKDDENEGGFLGGLFTGIGKLVDLAEKLEKEGGVISKQGEIKDLGKKLSSLDKLKDLKHRKDIKGVYGFTIRSGIGGTDRPRVKSFGNVKKTPKGPVVEETREPMVDVFEEKDYLLIVTEIPGVDEDQVKIELKEDILTLEAGEKGHLHYKTEVSLPYSVDPKSKKMSYKNGILNIEFKPKKTKKSKK